MADFFTSGGDSEYFTGGGPMDSLLGLPAKAKQAYGLGDGASVNLGLIVVVVIVLLLVWVGLAFSNLVGETVMNLVVSLLVVVAVPALALH